MRQCEALFWVAAAVSVFGRVGACVKGSFSLRSRLCDDRVAKEGARCKRARARVRARVPSQDEAFAESRKCFCELEERAASEEAGLQGRVRLWAACRRVLRSTLKKSIVPDVLLARAVKSWNWGAGWKWRPSEICGEARVPGGSVLTG